MLDLVFLIGGGSHIIGILSMQLQYKNQTLLKNKDKYVKTLNELASEREFDIMIDDLSIESSSERLDKTSNEKTNNVIK